MAPKTVIRPIKMRVYETSPQLTSTIINLAQIIENNHLCPRKIWAHSKSMGAHKSQWEWLRVPCQSRARVWTCINSHPHLAQAYFTSKAQARIESWWEFLSTFIDCHHLRPNKKNSHQNLSTFKGDRRANGSESLNPHQLSSLLAWA